MFILLKERGYPIDAIVFADTGAELPETYEFISKVEEWAKQRIDVVRHPLNWFDWFYRPWARSKKNWPIHGFPMVNRIIGSWCTRSLKIDPLEKYADGAKMYVGISANERRRKRKDKLYPLVDWKLTSLDCYNICIDRGLLNPIYEKVKRSGCWPCPNQGKAELRNLYRYYPDLWVKLLKLEEDSPTRFSMNFTLAELDKQFKGKEMRQPCLIS